MTKTLGWMVRQCNDASVSSLAMKGRMSTRLTSLPLCCTSQDCLSVMLIVEVTYLYSKVTPCPKSVLETGQHMCSYNAIPAWV